MGAACTGSGEAWFYMTEHADNCNMSDPTFERNSRPIDAAYGWIMGYQSGGSAAMLVNLMCPVSFSSSEKECARNHILRSEE